jgi:hypothetical protein
LPGMRDIRARKGARATSMTEPQDDPDSRLGVTT